MIFDVFPELYNYHHSQILEYFYYSKNKSCAYMQWSPFLSFPTLSPCQF